MTFEHKTVLRCDEGRVCWWWWGAGKQELSQNVDTAGHKWWWGSGKPSNSIYTDIWDCKKLLENDKPLNLKEGPA